MRTEPGIVVFVGDSDDGNDYPHPTHDRQNPYEHFMVLFTDRLINEIFEAEWEGRVVGSFDRHAQREQQQAGPIGRKIRPKKTYDLPERTNSDSGIDLEIGRASCRERSVDVR